MTDKERLCEFGLGTVVVKELKDSAGGVLTERMPEDGHLVLLRVSSLADPALRALVIGLERETPTRTELRQEDASDATYVVAGEPFVSKGTEVHARVSGASLVSACLYYRKAGA